MGLIRLALVILIAFLVGLALAEPALAQSSTKTAYKTQSLKESSLKTETNIPRIGRALLKPQTLEGSWNLRLAQKRFENPFEQKTTSEFRLGADLFYRPLEMTTFRLAPRFFYSTGFQQSQETRNASNSEWGVKEASVTVAPWSFFEAATGALDQSRNHPALLMDEQSFPAARLQFQTPQGDLGGLALAAETAIPTSSSLSTQTREFEKTPGYNSAVLAANAKSSRFEGLLRVGAYEFQNLPQSVAQKSAYLGNSTRSRTGDSSLFEFANEFQGTFASLQASIQAGSALKLSALAEWVKNSKAAEGFNQGSRSEISADLRVSSNLILIPSYEFFRIEPDAAVASYNGISLNTNRIGYQAGIGFSFKNTMKVILNGGERDVLFLSPLQQRERTWNFKLETSDAAI